MLVRTIPGMEYYSQTRKSVFVCVKEYVQQLQMRERRLRAQVMSHHLRERALVSALIGKGATIDEIGQLCGEAAAVELNSGYGVFRCIRSLGSNGAVIALLPLFLYERDVHLPKALPQLSRKWSPDKSDRGEFSSRRGILKRHSGCNCINGQSVTAFFISDA